MLVNGPYPLSPGSSFAVIGYGFRPGSTYLYAPFGVATLQTTVAQSNGNLAFANLNVPYTQPAGTWTAILHNQNDPLDTLPVVLTVQALTPTVTLSPTSAPGGSSVGLAGSGFGANEVVDVNFGPVGSAQRARPITRGPSPAPVTMPTNVPSGSFSIDARGESTGALSSSPFTTLATPTGTATPIGGSPPSVTAGTPTPPTGHLDPNSPSPTPTGTPTAIPPAPCHLLLLCRGNDGEPDPGELRYPEYKYGDGPSGTQHGVFRTGSEPRSSDGGGPITFGAECRRTD